MKKFPIGDPVFPVTPFSMKEFDNFDSDEEVIFNSMLRSARNQVECSFGHLKARWAILTRKMNLKLEILPHAIYACFVLHNYVHEKVVKLQIEILKMNEGSYKNIPDPTFSSDFVKSTITRKITQYTKDCS